MKSLAQVAYEEFWRYFRSQIPIPLNPWNQESEVIKESWEKAIQAAVEEFDNRKLDEPSLPGKKT